MTPADAIFAVFSEDVAFARHFVAAHRPTHPTHPPCRSASGIDYPSKKLSKMAGYSDNYPFNSWCIGRV